ncbi:MAG: F0F1 ATP synthase subunit epsilon [Gemmatimonadetes bacterium]|nr:F0F1 ATP synthase subunit epsilon [Gemmatimonadota bacterium]
MLSVALITPDATVYEGEADMVVLPAWDGEVGILRGHAPMMALLGSGRMRVTVGSEERSFHVSGGFMQIADDVVSVLSEKASAS